MGVLPACMCVPCVYNTHQSQKACPMPWNWSLQMVVSCHVAVGLRPESSERVANALSLCLFLQTGKLNGLLWQ